MSAVNEEVKALLEQRYEERRSKPPDYAALEEVLVGVDLAASGEDMTVVAISDARGLCDTFSSLRTTDKKRG